MFSDTIEAGSPRAICNGFHHLIKKKILGPFVDLDKLRVYPRF